MTTPIVCANATARAAARRRCYVDLHTAINAFGVVLLDNALLEPLAVACAAEGSYEFMLNISPLVVPGGTGSPVNPIAIF